MFFLQTAKKRGLLFLRFTAQAVKYEAGVIYPHTLFIFLFIIIASISAAEGVISKTKTAEYLTEYYELRIVEIIALRKVLAQTELTSFSFHTNKGKTKVEINEFSEKEKQIRIVTLLENRTFQAAFYYNIEKEEIIKRIEHQ